MLILNIPNNCIRLRIDNRRWGNITEVLNIILFVILKIYRGIKPCEEKQGVRWGYIIQMLCRTPFSSSYKIHTLISIARKEKATEQYQVRCYNSDLHQR